MAKIGGQIDAQRRPPAPDPEFVGRRARSVTLEVGGRKTTQTVKVDATVRATADLSSPVTEFSSFFHMQFC